MMALSVRLVSLMFMLSHRSAFRRNRSGLTSWSAVDEVTEGEETVALGEEADAREHRLERVELAVHVADHEITASGRIGSHAGERTLRLLPSGHPCTLWSSAVRRCDARSS